MPHARRRPLDGRGAASTATRVVVLAAIALAAALVALLTLRDGGYAVTATFENAGQLVVGNPVEVGGRPVGKVTGIELDDASRARVTFEVDGALSPLHAGTQATIHASSVSGIANRAVWLTPGPSSAPRIPDGGSIGAGDTETPVELDQLFDALDPRTRAGLRRVIRGSAAQYAGKGDEAGRALEYLSPALSATSRLTREVTLDSVAFERLVQDGARVVRSVAARRNDLAGLVSSLDTTLNAIGEEDGTLERTLALLPPTLGRATTTFRSLRATFDALDPLVAASKPATRELAPLLRRLEPLTRDAVPTVGALRRLVRLPGSGNDLIDLTRRLPQLASVTSTSFPRAVRALSESQPVLDYARLYTPDVVGWLTKFGQVAAAYDANGHYARIQPLFSPFRLDPATNTLRTRPAGTSRLSDWDSGNTRRCPGTAGGAAPDGSSPIVVDGCDPADSVGAP